VVDKYQTFKEKTMKKILLGGLLLYSSLAYSQAQSMLQVMCFPLKALAEVLAEFKEEPFIIGEVERADKNGSDAGTMILFVNRETKTWTVAEKHKSGLYCILTGGSKFSLVDKGNPI